MKLWPRDLVSNANHKNVAVWSTRSTLVSGRLVQQSRQRQYSYCVTMPHCTFIIMASTLERSRVTVAVSLARSRAQPSESGKALRYKQRIRLSSSVNYHEAGSIYLHCPRHDRSPATMIVVAGASACCYEPSTRRASVRVQIIVGVQLRK